MSPLGPLPTRLWELLSDGHWQDMDHVLAELGKMVPPGRAIREMERSRRNGARTERAATSGRVFDADETQLVRSGQRRIALATIHNGVKNGWVEVDPPASGGRRKVRNRRVRMVRVPAWAEWVSR